MRRSGPWRSFQALSPAARWVVATAAGFSLVALAGHARVPGWGGWVAGNVVLIGLMAFVVRPREAAAAENGGRRLDLLEEVRAQTPLLAYLWLYRESEFLSLVLVPKWRNEWALAWDRNLFGELPTLLLLEHRTPLLTEWLAASYFLYLPALSLVPFALSTWGRPGERDRVLHGLAAAFSISYAGFLLVPLQGPRFSVAEQLTEPMTGWLFTTLAGLQIEHGLVGYGGCLPSAHVAAATVLLAALWRLGRGPGRRRWWPFAAGLLIIAPIYVATVYLELHYAVDVVTGLAVGAAVVWATTREPS